MVSIRDGVADLVFIIKAPMDGIEQALVDASRISRAWDRLRILMSYRITPWRIPVGGYRRELLSLAQSLFSAGSDPGITFMALLNRYNQLVQERISELSTALVAIIVMSIITSVLGVMTILGAPPILSLAMLLFIPLIHEFQVEVTSYDYLKPVITGLAGLALGAAFGLFLIRHGIVDLALIGFGAGFATLYLPQFAKFLGDYSTMYGRVMSAFDELLHGPGAEFRPRLPIERELRPLWLYALSVGSRDVIERVIMLVSTYLDYVRKSVRQCLVYGPFVNVSFAFTVLVAHLLSTVSLPSMQALPFTLNPGALVTALLPMAVATALVTGKSMHSIGLGISLMPIYILLTMVIA